MKKTIINPNRARVKGNILANWEDVLTKSNFEDFHVSREEISNIAWNKHSLKAIRLNGKGEPVKVGLTADNTSIYPNGSISNLSINVQYTKNGTLTALPNHTVYLYDGSELLSTLVTDANGLATFEYSSNVQGTHTITARTPHMNGFEAGSARLNVNIIWTVELYLEPTSLYVGHGEIHQLKATLLDSANNPVPDKPIVFTEGVRALATVTTDENGVAVCEYMESTEQGTPTSITATSVPVRLDYGTSSQIKGKITTASGEIPVGEYIRLYSSKSTYAYVLASALIQEDGSFTLNYNPVVKGNYEYYLVYQGVLNYDSVNIVQVNGWFNLDQWIGSGTGGSRYLDAQTCMIMEQQNNYLRYYGNDRTYIDGDTWKYYVDAEIVPVEGGYPNMQVGDFNSIEGNTVIRYTTSGEWRFMAWQGSTIIINDVIADFANAEHPRNQLTIKRTNSTMSFKYKAAGTNETVTLTRTFNQSVPEDSRLMFGTNSASGVWRLHGFEIERYDPLRIHQTVNEFNLSEWGGTGLSNRSIDNNGVLILSNQNNILNIYPDNENYLNGYKWRIILDIELNGTDSVNNQQIYDQNTIEGNTAIRRENNVWKFLAWDENKAVVKNQIIDDVVNEQYPRNKVVITRDNNIMYIQYTNKATGDFITLSRNYNSGIAYDSQLVIVSTANAYWKLYNLDVEEYTRKDNYRTFEPTFTNVGTIPLYIDGELVDDDDKTIK